MDKTQKRARAYGRPRKASKPSRMSEKELEAAEKVEDTKTGASKKIS
jgi:hypothetical protein